MEMVGRMTRVLWSGSMPMNFFIVTPSRNQCGFLRRCVASIADQVEEGVVVHHHVQDACSTDGTVEFLQEYASGNHATTNYRFTFSSEADAGMYDAVNRGWQRTQGGDGVVAYLNCDEQYLPHALAEVSNWFDRHRDKQVLFGNVVVVDGGGGFICCRKVVLPFRWHIMTDHLPVFTAATFIRLDALKDNNLFFDTKWRDLGDVAWVLGMLDKGVRMGRMSRYLTAFADTDANMNLSENAEKEKLRMRSSAPVLVQLLRPVWVVLHRVRKACAGAYRQKPFRFEVYASESSRRIPVVVDHPETRWLSRLQRRK